MVCFPLWNTPYRPMSWRFQQAFELNQAAFTQARENRSEESCSFMGRSKCANRFRPLKEDIGVDIASGVNKKIGNFMRECILDRSG